MTAELISMTTSTTAVPFFAKLRAARALGIKTPVACDSGDNITYKFIRVTPDMEAWLSRHPEAFVPPTNPSAYPTPTREQQEEWELFLLAKWRKEEASWIAWMNRYDRERRTPGFRKQCLLASLARRPKTPHTPRLP